MPPRRIPIPVEADRYLGRLEGELRKQLPGKTLLGEIVFPAEQCDELAEHLAATISRLGAASGIRRLTGGWPLCVATWLVNEAFYNFASGECWPPTLAKIGIADVGGCSVRLGRAFLECLSGAGLPRFQRLKTRWSYLGPLLAHCGVPRSCLPELFGKVLPRAAELGVLDGVGFADLRADASHLYLRRATERFLVFGERIAEDFVRRALEMDRLWRAQGYLPKPAELGLPERVLEAYREWAACAGDGGHAGGGRSRRAMRRPEIMLDPRQGALLVLPSQKLEVGEASVTWAIEPDSREPELLEARPWPGERSTPREALVLAEPFATMRVHASIGGQHVASWDLAGLSRQAPVLFFEPQTFRLASARSLSADLVGIARRASWRLEVRSGEDVAPIEPAEVIGPLPLAWSELVAGIYDLSGAEALYVVDDQGCRRLEVELDEAAHDPQLAPAVGQAAVDRDGCLVFVGAAPLLRLFQPEERFRGEGLDAWKVEATALSEADGPRGDEVISASIPRGLVASEPGSSWRCVDLGRLLELGPEPWGELDVRVRGPLGQSARFAVRVVPRLAVESRWIAADGSASDLECRVSLPPGMSLSGVDADSTEMSGDCVLQAPASGLRVALRARGMRGRLHEIPIELGGRVPTWALYDPMSARQLVRWGREPFRLAIRELAATPPTLLLRLAMPRGLPRRAWVVLAQAEGELSRLPLDLDSEGFCRFEMLPLLSLAAATSASRLEVRCELDLGGLVSLRCGQLTRAWSPATFSAAALRGKVVFRWDDALPVAERCIEIVSLLAPWRRPSHLPIPPTARGELSVPRADALPSQGRYLASIGLLDPWTERFERADVPAVVLELGKPYAWRKAIASGAADDAPQDGAGESGAAAGGGSACASRDACAGDATEASRSVASLLVDLTSGARAEGDGAATLEVPRSAASAACILAARGALRRARAPGQVLTALERVLRRLPPACVLAAVAQHEGSLDAATVLDWNLLTRAGALRADLESLAEGLAPLDDQAVRRLWRLWPPLGLWVDTIWMGVEPEAASRRIVHALGADTVQIACAVAPGASLRLDGPQAGCLLRARVAAVDGSGAASPFDIERLALGVAVQLELEAGGGAILSRRSDGGWRLESVDGGGLPEPLCGIDPDELRAATLAVRYSKDIEGFGAPPDYPLLQLVRAGRREVLEQIQQHSRLPEELVGPAGFAAASFRWCLRAAEAPEARRELVELGEALVDDLGRLVEAGPNGEIGKSGWWTLRMLRRRWIPNAYQEPLYAVPLACGALVAALLWRGLGRAAPLPLDEERLEQGLATLARWAPELLAHDLMMVCLAEAAHAARRWANADRPLEAHARAQA